MKNKFVILTFLLISGVIFLKLTINFWMNLLPECYILKNTGLYCPGCGATRAVAFLLNGKIWTAFKYNPGVVSLAVIIVLAISEKMFNKKILPDNIVFWVVFIIVLFGYYILRNFTLSLSAL